MCVNYRPPLPEQLDMVFGTLGYGMLPRRHIPPGVKPFDTMKARAESLGENRSFAPAWRRPQLVRRADDLLL